MEEEKEGGAGTSSRVSTASLPQPSPTPPLPSSSSNPPPKENPSPAAAAVPAAPEEAEVEATSKRQLFTVELKPGETTIVSWKKLLKETGKAAEKSCPPAGPVVDPKDVPADASAVPATEGDPQDAPPTNRFSAVIEKIERLYMGEKSSDEEELDDVPDDDQYDTEDSFIDDAELDEYFQVDKLSTKHNGYFVNRGKLENIESSSSPNVVPKKRRRKDSSKVHREDSHEHVVNEPVSTSNMRIKAAARNAPLIGKKSSPAKVHSLQTNVTEPYQEGKVLKNKVDTSTGTYKKRSSEYANNLENPSSVRVGKDVALLALESKDFDKHKAPRDRTASSQVESQTRKSLDENDPRVSTKVRQKERYATGVFQNMNSAGSAYPMQTLQPSSTRVNEGSAMRPKGTTLERAIRDFEKIVALCRPPKLDIQEEDASQGVKRRLPREVKLKLAKVARLAASQNKITEDDLINHLMGIVGHLVQRKTLKRNLREMVELGLSVKQQKADRFQQIKQEVNEMIRTRVSLLKSKVLEKQDGLVDDFQEVHGKEEQKVVKTYNMDTALEDKICDLYDLHVEGMDEDKGPQSRKLYVELAELWPNGYMDNYGIKDAISRSKERKSARLYRHKARDEERIKRKRIAMGIKVKETSLGAQVQSGQERPADSTSQAVVHQDKAVSNQSVAPDSTCRIIGPVPPSSDVGHHQGLKDHDKARLSSITRTVMGNGSKMAVAEVKKKTKRKPESNLGEIHGHPTKLPSQHGREKHSSHKDEMSATHFSKQNLQLPVAPGLSDRPS